MKKNLALLIPILIIFFCFIGIKYLADIDEIVIKDIDVTINIDDKGNMTVSEKWVVKWPEGKSVSFRDIGYSKYHSKDPLYQDPKDLATFSPEVNVKVFDKNNKELANSEFEVGFSFKGDKDELGYPVECYPERSQCESIFIHVYSGMQSQMTFVYDYKIIGAVTEYNDIAELNWNLLEYFESGVKEANVTINIPGAKKNDIRAWGHGLSQGTVNIKDNQVILSIDEIKKGEVLEFRILFPENVVNPDEKNIVSKNMVDAIVQYEQELADETNTRVLVANIVYYGSFVLIALIMFIIYRIYIKYDKEYTPNFIAKYYRELPATYTPAEMSYLYYFKKINDEDVTATLLDLIRRKYLELDTLSESVNSKDPNFKIRKAEGFSYNGLLKHEAHLVKWFIENIGDGKEVTIKQIEEYPKKNYASATNFQQCSRQFVIYAKEAGKKHDFFEDNNKGKANAYGIIPVIYLFICLFTASIYNINNLIPIIISIVLAITIFVYVSTIQKRSVNGNEDYQMWNAFKNFLEDFGRMQDYPMPGIVVWEHFLVYATSLKCADKVMQQLRVKVPNLEEVSDHRSSTFIYFGYRYYGFNLGYTLGRINTTMTNARHNSQATIQAHNAQRVGGSGQGGGFGGGSSFGGGGGGFRGR